MNVRTYVRGADGQRGIWFFTLEADRLAAVLGARLFYRLPYRWARMRVRYETGKVEYASRRCFGRGGAKISIRIGSPILPGEQERFLTARFRLYTTFAGRVVCAQVEHPPWSLTSATVLHLEENVVENSGLPAPAGEPLAHFSPGVYVRIGPPQGVALSRQSASY